MTHEPFFPRGFVMPGDPDELYAGTPPWDIGRPQPAFVALGETGAIRGRVLDVGCGTGEHVLLAAGLGLDATGVDVADRALRAAEAKANDRGLTARFLHRDALRLADVGGPYDTVLDCGLFHLFEGDERRALVAGLEAAVAPGGRYFMLGFSVEQPGEWGPHRLTREEIAEAFADGWRVEAIEPAAIHVTTRPEGIRAWLTTVTRV